MSMASRVAERILDLPPAVTRRIRVERDLDVRCRDGVSLRTDHYAPTRLDDEPTTTTATATASGNATAPTILIRTPYGRRGVIGLVYGRVLAERGFHVVLQSCRGTFDSGGTFTPMRHERDDGLDAIAWLEKQPWFDGRLFTFGPSYVGFTQWAIAADAGLALTGMLTAVTASSFREPTYAGGAFSLDTVLNWATLVNNQGGSLLSFMIKQGRTQRPLRRAWMHLPLAEADAIASGTEIAFFREWLARSADEPYWLERSHDHRIERTNAAVCMVGGWYDIFLPWQLADYARLHGAGHQPRLVIGPWSHASRGLFVRSMHEGIAWFRALADGQHPETDPEPVRLYVGGAERWRRFATWPPAGRTAEWAIGPGGVLAQGVATGSTGAGAFRYDPADPTPSPGGPLLTAEGGRRDNTAVEARADVLVYTTEALTRPVEAIGPVAATVRLRSSASHFDIFLRVCDVDERGRSENICDGLIRVGDDRPPGSVRDIEVALWPTAYRWARGHRIRVQVAGGAHPRYARNLGGGEPLGSAVTLRPVDHEVLGGALRLHETS
jgi:putative CocE/NonD family hydrolase